MWEYANGIDDSPVISWQQEAKGIGNSTTLREDVTDEAQARKILLSLSESVSGRLRQSHQLAQTITVEIKYADFTRASHQTQLLSPSNTTRAIHDTSCTLFSQLWDGRPVRLLGIRSSRLLPDDAPVQLNLFDLAPQSAKKEGLFGPSLDKLKKLDAAMDQIRSRYGHDAVVRGTFLKKSLTAPDSGRKSAADPLATGHHPPQSPADNRE